MTMLETNWSLDFTDYNAANNSDLTRNGHNTYLESSEVAPSSLKTVNDILKGQNYWNGKHQDEQKSKAQKLTEVRGKKSMVDLM
jgi:hypothetical protein